MSQTGTDGSIAWWPQHEWTSLRCLANAPQPLPLGEVQLGKLVPPSFSMDQLDRVLKFLGYRCWYDPDERLIGGLWNEVEFYFDLSECSAWLGISSNWDAGPNASPGGPDDLDLQELSNEWNRRFLQPTAYPAAAGGVCSAITLHYTAFVGAGISDAQLKECVHRALDVSLQAHAQLVTLLPG